MLKLAICDDDMSLCGKLDEQLTMSAMDKGMVIETAVFNSGESLIRHLSDGRRFDAVFLDIEMGEFSGIDVGRWIREQALDEQTKVIYISWEKGYAMDLFQVRPMDFLLKPITDDIVSRVLTSIDRLCANKDQWFYFKVKNDLQRIAMGDIISLESENRMVRLVTIETIHTFYGKLNDVIKALDPNRFWQIHKSYIVNTDHVMTFEYDAVTVTGDRMLPVSQSRRKDIRNRQMRLHRGGQ